MPAEPLVDLSTLDLSSPIVSKEGIYSLLKQRGRFALLDGILHLDLENDLIVGFKDVGTDEWWCEDHIPGRPIFPGTLMVEAAAQVSSFDFYQRRPEAKELFCGFTGIANTRFRSAVAPPTRFHIVGRVGRVRAYLFHYYTQGFVDGEMVFESEIKGMVIPERGTADAGSART